MLAGVLHIILFFGFLMLAARSTQLVVLGFVDGFTLPGFGGSFGAVYNVFKDYAGTAVFICRRHPGRAAAAFKPARYAVPERYGKDHTPEAHPGAGAHRHPAGQREPVRREPGCRSGRAGAAGTPRPPAHPGLGIPSPAGGPASTSALQAIHLAAYTVHDLVFFFFLCFLPLGKHFHVITSLFNVFCMRVDTGNVKPVRHGVDESKLDELKSFGVKTFEDFTWKHMLDFYSCADCGRCSDHCPANRVKRPLSPRFISIKARDYGFRHYPLRGPAEPASASADRRHLHRGRNLVLHHLRGLRSRSARSAIEYIDKMVDLRRGHGRRRHGAAVAAEAALSALKSAATPGARWKRSAPTGRPGPGPDCPVKLFENGETAETLYFVDSITSYDDRMQKIAQATARILCAAGVDFGILGKDEKDSGHEVRRFGEEMLFQTLKEQNTEAIQAAEVKRIVTADPHAYNALKKDYSDLPPVQHISEVIVAGAPQRHDHAHARGERLPDLRLPRPLLPRPAQCALRRAPAGHRRHPGDPAGRDDRRLPRPLLLLRRRRAHALLRARGGAAHGGRAGADGPKRRRRRHRDRLPLLPGEHRGRHQGGRPGGEDGGDRPVRAVDRHIKCLETDICVALRRAVAAAYSRRLAPHASRRLDLGLYDVIATPDTNTKVKSQIPKLSERRNRMEILVCVKRVPDSAENEIELKADGSDIQRDDLVYSVNEWDNYAVEEAIQIVDRVGGSVTVATVGDEESEEVVRREMAMGANRGLLLVDPAFEGSDGRGIAAILKAAVQKGKYDLVLTGAQADDGAAQVGGMLAAMLDWPYASLVNRIEVPDGEDAENRPRNRGRQPGDQRDRTAVRALHPDGHQRAALRRDPGHPQGGIGGDPRHERRRLGVDPAAVGQAGARREARRLLRAAGRRRGRDAAGQRRGDRRQADRSSESQRRAQVMAAQVFAFIVHKDGAADDSALELISAARNMFPDASPTAILTGAGAGLDAVCQAAAASYQRGLEV